MKKLFTAEFLGQVILQFIILGLFMTWIRYKEAPLTAAETLKKENFLNAKRDTYYDAINILNLHLAYSDLTINGIQSDTTNRNVGRAYPSDIEINNCFSKLCIYSDNSEIPLTYQKMLVPDKTTMPVLEMTKFVNLVKQDLGYGGAIIDTTNDNYKIIRTHRKH